ncbi:MAG: alanine racemase [Eubacteriales bacterium]|nr:alanine racemase [Eubacteriales bacterium]
MSKIVTEDEVQRLYPRGYVVISVDAIRENLVNMHRHCGQPLYCVVKANAYGHGAALIAPYLEAADYVKGFATATVHEALELREAGIKKEILVLGTAFPTEYETAIRHQITLTVYRSEDAREMNRIAASLQSGLQVHIALDTGMGRIGLPVDSSSLPVIREILSYPQLEVSGMFTHFARADEEDDGFTEVQLQRFQWIRSQLADVDIPCWHVSNSAAVMATPAIRSDAGRAGIAMYGIYPSAEVRRHYVDGDHTNSFTLRPVLSWYSCIAHIKEVEAGTPISYGSTFIAPDRMRIATIPIGYGDGYPRALSNVGFVLIQGQRCPIIGRICMDQFMVDISSLAQAKLFEPVVLLGEQEADCLSLEEITALYNGFDYEFLCDINLRVPRLAKLAAKDGPNLLIAE